MEVSCRLTTLCGGKDHQRRQPPLSRLGTGTVRVQTVAEGSQGFVGASIYGDLIESPGRSGGRKGG